MLTCLVALFSPEAPGNGGIPELDKVVHACLFAALAGTTRWRFGRGLLPVLAFAAVSEVLQAVLPISRDGDVLDVLADSAGALLSWILVGQRLQPTGRPASD